MTTEVNETTIKSMLTTKDNPWNPFDEWDAWYKFDVSHGGLACRMNGLIATTSDALSDAENSRIINQAIDDIIAEDFENKFVKVTKEVVPQYV